MIRKKKIIRIRRNPSKIDYFDKQYSVRADNWAYFFLHIIEHPTIKDLIDAKVRWNQGGYCEDCNKNYDKCECEYCEDCKQNRCVCILEDLGIDDKTIEGRIKIRKIIWELTIKYLNKQERTQFLELLDLDPYTVKRFKISNKEYKFLKSLTSSTKFPEYTPIMKKLFEIDQ